MLHLALVLLGRVDLQGIVLAERELGIEARRQFPAGGDGGGG